METVCLKLDETLLKNVDTGLKHHNFSTRTEFIRTAIREKLAELEKDQIIKEFLKLQGKSKTKTTNKELRTIREKAYNELIKDNGWLK